MENNMIDLQKIPTFGIAGNFTGHLEQAGEAKDFENVKTVEAKAPKAIFPTYLPVLNKEEAINAGIPEYLLIFPFDSKKIIFPQNEKNIQIEPECAFIFDVEYENNCVKNVHPVFFGASNDCSIRKEGAKKISEKKNWGHSTKGFSDNLIPVDSFSTGSILDNYRIASFVKRDGEVFEYGENSRVQDYSYFYEKLIEWIIDRFNNQKNEGPAENISDYLKACGNPPKIMISVGATRYTDFGEHNYLMENDETYVIIYPESKFSISEIIEMVKNNNLDEKYISSLIQKVIL